MGARQQLNSLNDEQVTIVSNSIQSTKDTKTMSKNMNNTKVENTNNVNAETPVLDHNVVRFINSDLLDNAIANVIFTPKKWNGLHVEAGLFDAVSAINAIREFVGEITLSAGQNVHIHNEERSKFDGMRLFYLGGNIVNQAIYDGHKELQIPVNGKLVKVQLPKTSELIGEWCQVKMRTDFLGRVIPANDENHMLNMTIKHNFLEKMFGGTKLVVFTEPIIVKGEVYLKSSDAAKRLREEMLDENGEFKSADEIVAPHYERLNMYSANRKVEKQTKRMIAAASVTEAPIASTITVNGQPMTVTEVPVGWYKVLDGQGVVKFATFSHFKSLNSENNLRTLATKGLQLESIKSLK